MLFIYIYIYIYIKAASLLAEMPARRVSPDAAFGNFKDTNFAFLRIISRLFEECMVSEDSRFVSSNWAPS